MKRTPVIAAALVAAVAVAGVAAGVTLHQSMSAQPTSSSGAVATASAAQGTTAEPYNPSIRGDLDVPEAGTVPDAQVAANRVITREMLKDPAVVEQLRELAEPSVSPVDGWRLITERQWNAAWLYHVAVFPYPAAPGYDLPLPPLDEGGSQDAGLFEDGMVQMAVAGHWRCGWLRVALDAQEGEGNPEVSWNDIAAMLDVDAYSAALGEHADLANVDGLIKGLGAAGYGEDQQAHWRGEYEWSNCDEKLAG